MRPRWFCAVALTLGVTLAAFTADAEKAGPHDNHPPEGFTALFNGRDLNGWQGHITMKERTTVKGEALEKLQAERNALKDETWKVQDGIIVHSPKVVEVKGKQQKRGVSLQTAKDYGDFELLVDWKIEKGGDSGIYLRGQPQVQIWDSDNEATTPKGDWHTGSGGLWNNPVPKDGDLKKVGKVPLVKADKAPGQWNSFRIVMKG